MFITRSRSSNSNRCGTSASRRRGPISGSSLIIVKTRSITSPPTGTAAAIRLTRRSASQRSVPLVLLIGFAVHGPVGLLLGAGVIDDARRRALVAMRGVLDQFPLAELEALGLAAAGLLDGLALFAPALGEIDVRIGRQAR